MSKEVVTVKADTIITKATQIMRDKNSSCVVVADAKKKPTGIVTENDFVVRVLSAERDPNSTMISTIMSAPLVHVGKETSILDAIAVMHQKNFSQLPVIENGHLVGLVRLTDLMQYLVGFFSAHRW
jgi:CBS domain-containing protein